MARQSPLRPPPGHASALLYALLHLYGYDLPLDELKRFRQWGSKTPGHPELGETPGVEMTTGPLGQGLAHGVGMVVAERWLAEHYNIHGHEIVDHYTSAIVSDGDMHEGVPTEAASIAASLKLGKLIYLYDDNDVQLTGPAEPGFAEKVVGRFEVYGWHVIGPIDGFDPDAVEAAVHEARAEAERPSLIVCKTVIGYGSLEQATSGVHGDPLGETDGSGFVRVDERLATNVEGVWALGDVVKGGPAFTHVSHDDLRVIKTNFMDGGSATISGRIVPYTVFIDPQLGRVALSEGEAESQDLDYRVAKIPMAYVARALETDETRGFMKAVVDAKTGRILGATVLGIEGGEIMGVLQMEMMGNVPYTTIRDGIFTHLTLTEALKTLFATVE